LAFEKLANGLVSVSLLLAPLPGLLAAEFPDDAALTEFAVEAGVGTGLAVIQALLAIGDLHFLAQDAGVPVRVMAAFIHVFHNVIISNKTPWENTIAGEANRRMNLSHTQVTKPQKGM
jgi:hypothetical protein